MKDVTPQRQLLVERARTALMRASSPRLHASLIVGLSGLAAFLASVVMLRLGVDGMPLRYAAAAVTGYMAFVALIRGWIALHRRGIGRDDTSTGDDGSVLDLISTPDHAPGSSASAPFRFGGGSSGGGGASRSFVAPRGSGTPARAARADSASGASGWGDGISLDADELVWVLLAIALAFIGVVAVGYVIYAAPLLLGEVALDAAVLGGAYRRLQRDEVQHWATGVLRRTAVPAVIVVVCAAGVGYCGQRLAPEARSIGGVIQALSE
jgi:hypothetical protein